MSGYETWRISFQSGEHAARYAYGQWTAIAAEVRRLRAEVTDLRLYAPAQRAGAMQPPVQIAPTRWPFWMNETDEEFKAWGNAHTEVAG